MAQIDVKVSNDAGPQFTLELDPYEFEIVRRAVRRELAADRVEFDLHVGQLEAAMVDDDWRNDPDVIGEREMLDRAEVLLRDLDRVRY